MRILVISDTHIPTTAATLPAIIKKEAKASDCCLHCGDFITYPVYCALSQWVKVYGVHGNMDEKTLAGKLPEKQILKFSGITFALTHGGGHPKKILTYVQKEFAQEIKDIDVFVFGHSHNPLNEEIDGKIYFNPGSPTDTVFAPYRSYGIFEIEKGKLKRRIVKIG
ncbi:MAG: metallophosphoesterase [Candidatus Omnitrophica bacterium]|nr:metallophosphoesterase [Candidatus Omnitrophota bacterium]